MPDTPLAPRPAGVHGSGRRVDELEAAGLSALPTMEELGMCDNATANEALRIEPRIGRLVVFFSHDGQGRTLRPRSFHGSCPVRRGGKAIAQRFYRWHRLNDENRLGALLEQHAADHGHATAQTMVDWRVDGSMG